jgi:hypothetical protein
MGKEAAEIAHRESSLVTQVVGQPNGSVVAAGLSDGGVWAANMTGGRQTVIRGVGGASVTALALSADGARLAFGDETGQAGVAVLPAL